LLIGTRLIIHDHRKTTEREMGKMVIAITSGILEGLLICAGIFTKNALALAVAVVFFVIQWKHLGKQE